MDYVSLTVPVSFFDQGRLQSWFDEERNFPGVETRSRFSRRPTGNYRRHFFLDLGGVAECLVELGPRRGGNFMRLDFNPSRSRNSLQCIVRSLQGALPRFSMSDVLRGQTTRIDICFDVSGIEMEAVDAIGRLRLREVRRFQQVREWDRIGRLNAIEIGTKGSPTQLRIYDKKVQLEAAHELGQSGLRRMYRSRIRYELQQRRWGVTDEVGTGRNPFLAFTPFQHDLVALGPSRNQEEEFFRQAVQGLGAQVVLSRLANQRLRDRYRELLTAAQPPTYWEPEQVWNEFREEWSALIADH